MEPEPGNDLRFIAGEAEVVRIDGPTANVGIGTANPSADLHVAGNVRVTGSYRDSSNSSGTPGQVLSSSGTGTDWVDAPTPVVEAWQTPTLQSFWTNYLSSYNAPAYFKDSSGVVHLRGLVRGGVINGVSPIFTLPTTHRPSGRGIFTMMSNNNMARVDVLPDGRAIALTDSNAWISRRGSLSEQVLNPNVQFGSSNTKRPGGTSGSLCICLSM